jgi:hypothetical protein
VSREAWIAEDGVVITGELGRDARSYDDVATVKVVGP